MLKPEFEKAKRAVGNRALFVEYNIDLGDDILRKYGVTHIPTMILFENGKAVDGVESVLDAKNIKEWVLGYVPQ
jgi:thioredoxin-like negative regulator of GroEL